MLSSKFLYTTSLLISSFYLVAQDTITTFYPNTQQSWEKVFVAGKKVAENIYHENGTPWMTFQYEADKTELYKWFHENGQPFFEATNVNGELQGKYRIWYDNGQLAEELNFVDNLENGQAVFYYPSGQLAMSGQYLMGKMIGDWKFLSLDGSPAEGEWKWQFSALPEFTRLSGSLEKGKPVGQWIYRTTATSKNGPQEELFWRR